MAEHHPKGNDYNNFLYRKTPLFIGLPVGVTIYTHDKVGEHQPPINYKWFKNEKQ